ncbi:MAG: peptidoglycan editing factor PgeF [Acidobacteriaceae bacterium]|nr:peptidoglycan editing factor PgeF [Acidobacteriaceae bacterium]
MVQRKKFETTGQDVVQVPEWKQYGWLRHGFSTRAGGVSTVYLVSTGGGELNLGWTREDDPAMVAENRRRIVAEMGDDLRLVTVRQVHGASVRAVGEEAFQGGLETAEGKAVLEGDGLMTRTPGVLLGIQTADCVPVLVVDVRQRVVAALHAGWRGTVARIVEEGVAVMCSEYGSLPEDLVGAVGPSIGACCYGVGDEVRGKFESAFGYADKLFGGDSGLHLDLWEANRRQLFAAGLLEEKITVVGECTACARNGDGGRRYFSHRDEKGFAGRMLSVVGVV